jgi:hypothetical protein
MIKNGTFQMIHFGFVGKGFDRLSFRNDKFQQPDTIQKLDSLGSISGK